MDYWLIAVVAVHALSGVFWAGSSSAMANLGAAAPAERLFPFQMGAAGLTVLSGLTLWYFWRGGSIETSGIILLVGIAAAIAAGAVQGILIGGARRTLATLAGDNGAVDQMTRANRIAAGLLAVTVAAMVVSRFF